MFSLGLGERVAARDVAASFPETAVLPVVTESHRGLRRGRAVDPSDRGARRPVSGPPEALEAIAHAGVPEAGAELNRRTAERITQAAGEPLPGDGPPRVAFLDVRGTAAVYLLGGEGSGADAMIEAAGRIDAGAFGRQ